MKRCFLLTLLTPFLFVAPVIVHAQESDPDRVMEIERILQGFAEDFRYDHHARDGLWGFEIDGHRWHMTVEIQEDGPATIVLQRNFPETELLYWVTDYETLLRMDQGMTGETATARANADDPAPLFVRGTKNFPRQLLNEGSVSDSLSDALVEFKQFFWVKGRPEIIEFNLENSRFSHDVNIASLHYAPGFRSFWIGIKPGQHANQKPEDQIRDFPTLFIITKGKIIARIGGTEVEVRAGQALRIPPNVTDEFWNPFDELAEGIMLIWGPNA